MKRLIRGLMAVAASLGLMAGATTAVVMSTPGTAQAWGYCHPTVATNSVTFARLQGMCGATEPVWAVPARLDKCINLHEHGIGDWAGALQNRSDYIVTVYQHSNCKGRQTWVPAQGIEFNLHDPVGGVYSLYHRASGMRLERR